MQRRDVLAGAAIAATASALPQRSDAFLGFGGGDPLSGAAIIGVLQAIQQILDSRFARVLQNARVIGQTAEVTAAIRAALEIMAEARGAYGSLQGVLWMFENWKRAIENGDIVRIANQTRVILDRGIVIAEEAVHKAGRYSQQIHNDLLVSGALGGLAAGTDSVVGQAEIGNQVAVLTHKQMAVQTDLLGEMVKSEGRQELERYNAEMNARAAQDRFLEGLSSDAEMPRINLGIGG